MSKENQLWGAPRIHGELLKLGFEIAESTVSKYMNKRRGPPSQSWRTFLRNHADAIAAIDLCVVPTLTFECLFAFLVLGHGRRRLLWFAVTRHPTAEWLAQQIVEAFPWDTAPSYLIRDNDGAYGQAFTNRVRTMGIRDRPISPRSPWQTPYVERLIGTLRRDCLDHVLIYGERHLRRVLTLYSSYYNETRTHLGLGKDAPLRRAVQRSGTIGSDFRERQGVYRSPERDAARQKLCFATRPGATSDVRLGSLADIACPLYPGKFNRRAYRRHYTCQPRLPFERQAGRTIIVGQFNKARRR